jgi:tetratricopeptide (TPR) repeat protein
MGRRPRPSFPLLAAEVAFRGAFARQIAAKMPGFSSRHKYFRLGALVPLYAAVIFLAVLFPHPGFASQTTAASPNAGAQSSSQKLPFPEVQELIRQGALDEAKTKMQEDLEASPASVDGYNLLGIICLEQKDYPGARSAFEHALALNPASLRTRNDLGNVYVSEGKLDLAAKEFRRILQAQPANSEANYNLGLVLLSQNQPAQAILHFQRVHPANAATLLNLTRAYLTAGRTAEGLHEAKTVSDQDKGDVQLHFTLGVLLADAKQFHAAQAELEQANALQPETPDILYRLGDAYFRGGDLQNAELVVNRAAKLKADSPETLYLLAEIYQREQRAMDALDLLVRAHKLAPDNADITFLLARISMSQNYFEDAIPLLESGLATSPKRADLRAALGESYFMSGKTEKAIEEFRQLVDVEPTARSYGFLGLAYRHLGRFDEARGYFQAGLKKDPRNVTCLFNLGYIEEHQGHRQRADELFQQVLRLNPDFPEGLLEAANLRMEGKQYQEAAALLRRYVKVSHEPSSGYYKLAMVERSLHQTEAAERDLNVFQTLSKNTPPGPYPYENLFDYLDNRSNLSREAQAQMDLTQLSEEINKHPGQPQNLYLLAETYLKLGNVAQAHDTVARLDQLSSGDYRTQTGIGVLLARYRLYDDAIQHFQTALRANAESDEAKFDLADAYFRKGAYADALQSTQRVSEAGQKDTAFLALLGDIYAHLGDTEQASAIFRDAIARNPDDDQNYLSLAMVQLRGRDVSGGTETLQKGLRRIPASGKILWGLGLIAVMEGKTEQAAENLERAVDLLPEWPGAYSTLGVFYYQTGAIAKAREVLNRFKGSNAGGVLDVNRIEQALAQAPEKASSLNEPMPLAARQQFLQFALSIADRTL